VSAHVGSVIIRKRGEHWVTAGENGCVVPPGRIERALDNLARLVALPSKEQPADGRSFELQIAAMIDEERAVYLNVAGRSDAGDLVQLADASMVRIRGLDRTLWSPHPADWCRDR